MRRSLYAALLLFGLGVAAQPGPPFDILITNARVFDGSGNPWMRADVGITGDRIAAVGHLGDATGAITIDAHDRYVAPGFIDVHSHALEGLGREELRDARGLIAQGVTTIVGNPDGGGPTDLKQQRATLEQGGIGVNAALLIGHGSVRSAVLGQAQRAPTADELDRMRAIVRKAVDDGAFGLSSGLFYTPGRFAKTEEVVELAKVAGGVYTSHIRDEGNYDVGVVASVDEVIRIADEAHVRGVVSHMKALGPDSWGQSATMDAHIEAARARGVDVWADQYPYTASSTSLAAAVMPGESAAGAREAMSGPESKRIFLGLIKENIRRRGGPASIVIASGRGAAGLSGKSLEDIAKSRTTTPEEAAVDIVLNGGASIVSFNMSDADVDAIMQQPWTMGSSDGGLVSPGPSLPHPRSNGAFARRLGVYVRERHVISIEQAIRTMTSLPAHVFALDGRGEVRPGAFADVVVFDLKNVVDRATYADPFQLADGMDWVIVNGAVARKDGTFTGARSGRVLKR